MGYAIPTYIVIIVLTIFSCGPSGESKGEMSGSADTLPKATNHDTLPEPTPDSPNLSPDMLRMEAGVIEITAAENSTTRFINVRVLEILEVGSSTPWVAATDTLQLTTTFAPDTLPLREGKNYILTISHRSVFGTSDNDAGRWNLEKIEPLSAPNQKSSR